ncbi:hypothetical protein HJC23_013663 [Cyclotella cryptica]|uniref:Uncharacterized protein n=1 Tax=Cyclotella cryptica TaxID=29204 RepID=A0ABD3QUR4_9STRA
MSVQPTLRSLGDCRLFHEIISSVLSRQKVQEKEDRCVTCHMHSLLTPRELSRNEDCLRASSYTFARLDRF